MHEKEDEKGMKHSATWFINSSDPSNPQRMNPSDPSYTNSADPGIPKRIKIWMTTKRVPVYS